MTTLKRYDMYCTICGVGNCYVEVEDVDYIYYECSVQDCVELDGYWDTPPLDYSKTSLMMIRAFIEGGRRKYATN